MGKKSKLDRRRIYFLDIHEKYFLEDMIPMIWLMAKINKSKKIGLSRKIELLIEVTGKINKRIELFLNPFFPKRFDERNWRFYYRICKQLGL